MSSLQFEHVIDQLAAIQVLRYEGVGTEEEYAEVDRVLQAFAEHILRHTTPSDGSTVLKYKGLVYFEIVPLLPDMESVKMP